MTPEDPPEPPPRSRRVYSQEEFDRLIREREQAEVTKRLGLAHDELANRITEMSKAVQASIQELRNDLDERAEIIEAKATRVSQQMEERSRQFRLADLGEVEMARLPDMLRWYYTNEPMLRILVQRALANTAVQERSHRALRTWESRAAIWAAVIAGTVTLLTATYGLLVWISHQGPR